MKRSLWMATLGMGIALLFASCGTQQKATTTETNAPIIPVENVTAQSDMISVAEAITIFEHPENTDAIVKKYGYKLKKGYEVYRLDKFSKMYYKNCTLAKLITKTAYGDYPKPLAKGVSSYIAFKEGAIIVAVFNQKAYDNLVAQVKANGFVLDMPGSEDIYKRGERTIACYQAGKSIRIQ
ncbi:MAG: hypothetical protein E7L36_03545 [Prevotella bivia]|uniref:Lipoprotein n=2 Tax=Prevotella bivia TaxID=28125 RepID=I4Z7Z5_9BACT|nr:hypothetical protein [Prevotella bivia]EIM32337.1 hypothetical protein PrebiDRAFT_0589 [Prevotella bivia DSM 20514]KGF38924.1 hypothetical protein HMPREF2136_00640 [Prevotella bivia DNF00650]KXO18425.1 hypothetical protein HMPREF3202_00083 [Prevotella bivia]KXU58668.1 hypothetical protein HMPREF3218_0200959 [Prevotella bivia]MBS6328589.1 hypothetical protein [Prevotella bivia]